MQKYQLIWNITQACPWNCSFCCINAYYLPLFSESPDTKLKRIKQKKIELSLEDKLKIVDNLDMPISEIDVSGGEPLLFNENINIITKLSRKFGRDSISITTTGIGLSLVNLDKLKEIVKVVEFTYDFPYEPNSLRPKSYNYSNLEQAKKVVRKSIKTIAQIPLTRLNVSKRIIKDIYRNLDEAGVNELFLMKFFPVGRGAHRLDLSLNKEKYQAAIELYKSLEKPNSPKISIQTALREDSNGRNSSHFNITSQGLLLSSPWAYNPNGEPINEFILGDLRYQKFSKIVKS